MSWRAPSQEACAELAAGGTEVAGARQCLADHQDSAVHQLLPVPAGQLPLSSDLHAAC